MSYDYPADPAPDPLAQAADLVRDLVQVIEYLTYANDGPYNPGRFVSIREDADVSDRVDPVLAAAQAYLASVLPPEGQ